MTAAPHPRSEPESQPTPGHQHEHSERAITAALLLLTTMIAFENMAVATAMPTVAAQLDAVSSYGLAFSAMMTAMLLGIVLAGPWADRSGPVPPVFWGQALFALGAIACGAAPTFGVLLLGRVITGLGAGLVIVAEFVVIGRTYLPARRPAVFGWISAAWVLPSLVGGPLAGWLTTQLSWRWVFWVVVIPAAVAAALLLRRRGTLGGPGHPDLADARANDARANDARANDARANDARAEDRTDDLGDPEGADPAAASGEHRRTARLGALVAGAAGLVQLAIHERAPLLSVMSAVAVIGLVGVAVAAPALLPPGTLRSARGLPSVVLTRALLNGSFLGGFAYLPLMLAEERGLDATSAGLVLAVGSLGWSAGSWAQGHRHPHDLDARARLVVAGAVMLAVGWTAFVALTLVHAPTWTFGATILLGGLGMGLGSTTLSTLVLELSPAGEHGRASAALQLADVLGTVVGTAAATAAFGIWHTPGEHRGFIIVWVGLAALGAVGILSAARCAPERSRPTEHVSRLSG